MAQGLNRWRKKWWSIDPHCHSCGRLTRFYVPTKRNPQAPDLATVDHVRSRYDPTRTEENTGCERRRVIACWECNQRRQAEETAKLPREELHRRSGRSPRHVA